MVYRNKEFDTKSKFYDAAIKQQQKSVFLGIRNIITNFRVSLVFGLVNPYNSFYRFYLSSVSLAV